MATAWKITRKLLGWSVVLIGLLLGVVIIGGILFLRTEQFRTLAREQIVDTLNNTLKGHISLERIEGSISGSLILHQLRLDYQGATLLHIPQLIARYELRPLLDGRVQVSEISLVEPVVHLTQDAEGTINLLEAVSPVIQEETSEEEPHSPSSLSIGLERIAIHDGQISFRQPDQAYQLNKIILDAQLAIVPAGLEATIRHLTLQALAEGFPPLTLEASATYQNTTAPSSVQLQQVRLTTDHSQLQLTGQLSNVDAPETNLGTDIELVLEKIGLADILQLAPEVPLQHDIAGRVQVTGPLSDMHAAVHLKTAEATIDVDAKADLSQQEPSYQATLTLTHIDVPELVTNVGDLQAVIHGTLHARGVGTAMSALDAQADLTVEKLQVADLQLGTVSIQAKLADETTTLNGELTSAVGHATWQGHLALTEPPQYGLTFAVDHLALHNIAAGQDALSGELNVHGTVHGTGFALPSMNTQANITIQPSRVGPVSVKHGRFIAQIANGRIHLSEGTLVTPDASLNIAGELGTALEEIGQLSYALRVDQLSPWLALAGQDGSGQLTLDGTAKGSLANLQTQGKLTAKTVQLPGMTLAAANIAFTADQLGQAQPQATVAIGLTDLHAGLTLQTVNANIQLTPPQSPSNQLGHQLHIGLTAEETPQRQHRLQAHVLAHPEQIVAQLQELSVALPIGTWQLAQPATLRQQATGITLDRFVLANQDQPTQQISLQGSVATTGPQAVQLQIAEFSLETLKDFLPPQPSINGIFSADIQVSGTAAAPVIAAEAGLHDVQIAGQDYAGLTTHANYQHQKAALSLIFQQDATHALHANGSLPVSLSWADGFQADMLGNPDFRVHSDGLSLAFVNAFSGTAVHDIAGEIQLDLQTSGPADKPLLNGTFALQGGQANVKPLGLKIAPISLTGSVTPQHVRVDQFMAKARKGTFSGTALVDLTDYQPQTLAVAFQADHWPAIWTHQYQVEIDSEIKANGPLSAPTVNGQIDVWRATLRPELSFLSAQPLSRDETIIVRSSANAPPLTDGQEAQQEHNSQETQESDKSAAEKSDVFTNLALQVAINLRRNTRIQHQNANIALAGGVDVTKKRGEDPRIAGVIELERGWAGFQGRRFVLNGGKITFTGGTQINPQLDILAQYKQNDYVIDAVVGGTGEEPALDLRSEPPLEQADILAVLLFGKPASALGKGEQADLQQQAMSLTSGYAAATIGRSVSDALGLENLGIDLSDVDFSGGQVGFGRSLNRKTRISASQSVGREAGQEVAIDYEIAPNLDLRTTTSSKGSSGADIIWRKRY